MLKNTYSTKSISKLEFRVSMCSNKICRLIIDKKWHVQNIKVLKFFEQKFCKTEISYLGMTITLANCKLGIKT
jgi:hypothetical protein